MSAHGPAHDPYETRGRLQGAEASDEFARWRELPPRLHPVEPQPLPLDLARLLHRLRLRYVRQTGPAILARAREEGWDHAHLLKVLFAEEAAGRDRSTREMHRKAARLPSGKTFDAWEPKASAIPGEAQWALRTLDWIGRAENLVLVGPSGTGKSHFAEAIAHAAIDRDLRVSWFTLETLTATIARSRIDASTGKVVERIVRSELVVVDDIGLLPAGDRRGRGTVSARRRGVREALADPDLEPASRPGSTRSFRRASRRPPSIASSTTPTSSSPRVDRIASPRPRGSRRRAAAGHGWQRAAGTARWSQQSEPGLNERCTVVVMGRAAVRALLGAGLLAGSLAMAAGVRAAGEVVVAVSPSEVEVGEPVEVLLRTFRIIDQSDLSLPFESPIEPYPVASGAWNILYSWADYPFDVVAQHEGDTDVRVALTRDPSDSTLWRGTMSLPSAGTWTIWVRNFPDKEPGSTTTVTVRPGRSAPAASPPPVSAPTTGTASVEAAPAAFIGVLVGLVVGALVAFAWRRRPTS